MAWKLKLIMFNMKIIIMIIQYRKSGNFRCKNIFVVDGGYEINLTKFVRTINANAVRGRAYEIFFTRKFIIQKFLYTKISRSTVIT